MKLKEHLDTLLPINRKERFYTGTVFPMIVCKDNFKNFHLFTQLLTDCSHADIDANPETTNIQFFTEYSLVESLFGKSKYRFTNVPETKDTPDIIIFIEGERNALIGIEAKMFDYPKPIDLVNQMDKQKKILNCIKENIKRIKKCDDVIIYQYALLPEGYLERAVPKNIDIITWQDLLNAYKNEYPNDYFIGMLKCALEDYKGLVGTGIDSYGENCDERMLGLKVYEDYKNNILEMKTIGRNKGIEGFLKDIKEGKWMTFKYETSKADIPPNKNWITVEEFVKIVDEFKKN